MTLTVPAAGMTKVVDPLGGSYYVESLTQQLVDQAWTIIERVEVEGGMAAAVAKGWPKAMIEEAAAARQALIDKFLAEGSAERAAAAFSFDELIDPADTRRVLGMGLAAAANAPVPEPSYGIFRM